MQRNCMHATFPPLYEFGDSQKTGKGPCRWVNLRGQGPHNKLHVLCQNIKKEQLPPSCHTEGSFSKAMHIFHWSGQKVAQ